jgi:hypothetical protein
MVAADVVGKSGKDDHFVIIFEGANTPHTVRRLVRLVLPARPVDVQTFTISAFCSKPLTVIHMNCHEGKT